MNNQMIAQNNHAVGAFHIGQIATMSSREIAELTGKRHDNVMRTIEMLYERGAISLPHYEEVPNDGPGPLLVKQYLIGKRDSYVIVAQLSPEFTARLVDRWQELESGSIPKTLSSALRLAADQAEQIERLAIERDQAIATKAQIGSRREATAMATAAKAKRETERLKDELGRNSRHATVIAIERATGLKFPKNAYVALRKWCKKNNAASVDVVDARYGSVKAWPAGAWLAEFDIDLADLFAREAL